MCTFMAMKKMQSLRVFVVVVVIFAFFRVKKYVVQQKKQHMQSTFLVLYVGVGKDDF